MKEKEGEKEMLHLDRPSQVSSQIEKDVTDQDFKFNFSNTSMGSIFEDAGLSRCGSAVEVVNTHSIKRIPFSKWKLTRHFDESYKKSPDAKVTGLGVIGSGDGGVGKTELINKLCSSDITWKRPNVNRTGICNESLFFEIDEEPIHV